MLSSHLSYIVVDTHSLIILLAKVPMHKTHSLLSTFSGKKLKCKCHFGPREKRHFGAEEQNATLGLKRKMPLWA